MALKVGWIILDTPEPANLAPFWEQLLGWRRVAESDTCVELAPPEGGARLALFRAPDPKVVKNRLHFDLVPDDQGAEVARALALGARRVDIGQGEEAAQAVMADPEGNEFCILTHEMGWWPIGLPQAHRSVPRRWWLTHDHGIAGLLYGAVIGRGVATHRRLPACAWS